MDFSAIQATIPCIRPRVSPFNRGGKKLTKMHFCHEIIKVVGTKTAINELPGAKNSTFSQKILSNVARGTLNFYIQVSFE